MYKEVWPIKYQVQKKDRLLYLIDLILCFFYILESNIQRMI